MEVLVVQNVQMQQSRSKYCNNWTPESRRPLKKGIDSAHLLAAAVTSWCCWNWALE